MRTYTSISLYLASSLLLQTVIGNSTQTASSSPAITSGPFTSSIDGPWLYSRPFCWSILDPFPIAGTVVIAVDAKHQTTTVTTVSAKPSHAVSKNFKPVSTNSDGTSTTIVSGHTYVYPTGYTTVWPSLTWNAVLPTQPGDVPGTCCYQQEVLTAAPTHSSIIPGVTTIDALDPKGWQYTLQECLGEEPEEWEQQGIYGDALTSMFPSQTFTFSYTGCSYTECPILGRPDKQGTRVSAVRSIFATSMTTLSIPGEGNTPTNVFGRPFSTSPDTTTSTDDQEKTTAPVPTTISAPLVVHQPTETTTTSSTLQQTTQPIGTTAQGSETPSFQFSILSSEAATTQAMPTSPQASTVTQHEPSETSRPAVTAWKFTDLHDQSFVHQTTTQVTAQSEIVVPSNTAPGSTATVTTLPASSQPVTTQSVTTQPVTTQSVTTQPGITQSGTTIPGTTLQGTTLLGTTLLGTTLPGTTLPGTTLPGTTLLGTTIQGTTVLGTTIPDTTLPIVTASSSSAPLPPITIGTTVITASASQYLIGTQTLLPGSTVVVSGTTIQLASTPTEIIVGSSTAIVTSGSIGGYIWSAIGSSASSTTAASSTASAVLYNGDADRLLPSFFSLLFASIVGML